MNNSKINLLIEKGVNIPNPETVEIGNEVDINRISGQGTIIYSGCKIYGKETFIHKNSALGYEAPATVENCCIGSNVQLKGGFFKNAVFLEKSNAGSGSHVREGTILEEQASIAHTVGLKQTILFPFVTLGSLINFCDCLMSGGTSRKNHSEVGSSYIHFNYTPEQDKATASLIGDVPEGVMLDQPPIFLGGQGGLVGPSRLAFGTVIAAGSIYRKDELRKNMLVFEGSPAKGGSIPFTLGTYRMIKRIVLNNIIYISNLTALRQWYLNVRRLFISEQFPQPLLNGLKNNIDIAIEERVKRFLELSSRMSESVETSKEFLQSGKTSLFVEQKQQLYQNCSVLQQAFHDIKSEKGDLELRDVFLKKIDFNINQFGKDYINTIKNLNDEDKKNGTAWLQGIVDTCAETILNVILLFR